MPYSDEQITKAREFYRNYVDSNNLSAGEHASVLALVAFLDANSTPKEDNTSKWQSELESLKTDLEAKIADHGEILKQRDHNWNELQKAQKEVVTAKEQITKLTAQVAGLQKPDVTVK